MSRVASPPRPAVLPAFDPNAFPLEAGIQLLEASAGTGKTFALAHLVLRLVAERGLPLRRLLVVTFTEAAATELRDRIDRRLQGALRQLTAARRGGAAPLTDAVMEEWIDGCRRRHEDLHLLQGRLLLALEELDGADISTIHGFCRRTLLRQGLEAGLSPGLTLDTDPDPLLRQVVHDYWQQQVLPLPAASLARLHDLGLNTAKLLDVLRRLDADPALQLDPLPPELPPQRPLAAALPALQQQHWQRFRREWQARGRRLEEDFRSAAAAWRRDGAGSTTPYSARPRRQRAEELERWLAGLAGKDDEEALSGQELLQNYFHPGTFSRVARKVAAAEDATPSLPQRPLLEAAADLVEGPADLVALHACHWGRDELARRRRRAATAGYGQLLESLDPRQQDDGVRRMLEGAADRYEVALIDEFQDTDPIQWRILRTAFGGGRHQLVLVGDPKQAIYRFRGGDLDTYRDAAGSAAVGFSLRGNHRATPELIAALNALMRPGLPRSALVVPPVEACSGRRGPGGAPIELLWLGGERAAGEKPPSRSTLENTLPLQVAAYAAELLNRGLLLGQTDPAGGLEQRLLEPRDVCLLVATHRQAEGLRAALERWGIASRLVSKADVFASPAATALQRFLDALADPASPGRLRLLAASPLMGWSAAEIAAAPAGRWSALAGSLEQVATQLDRRGLLGGLASVLGGEGMARLSLGGRLLADLQQVAELVEEHLHAARLGPAAAAEWLRRLRLDPDRSVPEAHQAHSDREDDAVSVVTIHRSKGLEYPVVICPTLWQDAPAGSSGGQRPLGVRWRPPGTEEPHLDLHRNRHWGRGHAAACADRRAEQAERERLAYVALTRACHLLVLAWGPADGQQGCPLLPWLFGRDGDPQAQSDDLLRQRSDADWRQRLEEEIRRRGMAIRLVDPSTTDPPPRTARRAAAGESLSVGPLPRHPFDSDWGRHSYTSWTHEHGEDLAPAALEEGRDTGDPEQTGEVAAADAAGGEELAPLAEFPRGPLAGDCLHRILEQLDYERPLADADNRSLVERELRRAGLPQQQSEAALEGLERMRRTPFGGPLGEFRVERISRRRRINEMHFDLCLERVRAADLAAVFRSHGAADAGAAYAERLELLPANGSGYLTGSIDLVFTAPDTDGDDRWWVADWKSNWLGRRDEQGRTLGCGPATYGQAAMAEVMVSHHYLLQAHLYLVALHRYLAWRLRDYDPARHLGGYAYVFLRGTPGPGAQALLPGPVPGMVVAHPPAERLLALDAVLGGCGGAIA